MSWLFSFLLVCYASLRLTLWVRGQLRWLSRRQTLPEPPVDVSPPAHLSSGLSRVFRASRELRVQLVHARRDLAAVAIKDPDAPLGQVRDQRYRRALMESWTHLRAWLRELEALERGDRLELEARSLDEAGIRALTESLRDKWRAVSRARALEPFAIAELAEVERALERIDEELVAIEQGLTQLGESPYRDRYAAVTEPTLARV
ncbi:hypothetical protein G6O69_22115 [Pseudenhygromyxa sp. WMMC2535]|uniref:hypothetical protein n=1 Tax=Pseudenhygromyxa sp. WMMC2535 TaxID=2712867 RepID=UPI0015534874|nr:hypothetical protein [Pseudenhygromyxa sp. WMMC2535]NVB40553.1 hypothetical protein [Pseudenhygromyxa sp. WMMC2535]